MIIGILQRATQSKEKTERAEIVENAQLDVLAEITNNKGNDLQESQLKDVLGKYFINSEIPEELPSNLESLELTTLNEKYKIKVSEIYNGNIAGNSKVKAATLFEDKAGDEEGATEGKIHIGDYVNYNPIAEGDTGTESKYKYQSSNNNTGVKEAISSNAVTGFTDSSQDFTTKSNLKWQIIGIDGENILITTENPIIPDNPVSIEIQLAPTISFTNIGYLLYGAKAYVNCNAEINNISKIYGYGKGSDQTKTRGLTIEDVNNITGVTSNGTTLIPNGIDMIGQYGNSYSYEANSNAGWNPSAWINKDNSTLSPGISGTVTGYAYQGSNASLRTATSTIRNKLIFGENNSSKTQYWTASTGVLTNPSGTMALFSIFAVGQGVVSCNTVFNSNGQTNTGDANGICPIVYLDSNTSLISAGTTNNITTWNID